MGCLCARRHIPQKFWLPQKNVKVVGRHGVGVNNIDLKYCKERGIVVTFAPESNGISVAEHTIGMMVAAAHNFARFDKGVREGEWDFRNAYKGLDLQGKTLGLIGTRPYRTESCAHGLCRFRNESYRVRRLCTRR